MEQFSMSKFASRQDREDAMISEIERLHKINRELVQKSNTYLILNAQLERQRDTMMVVLEKTAEGVKARKALRGFLVPEDASDLLNAINGAIASVRGEG